MRHVYTRRNLVTSIGMMKQRHRGSTNLVMRTLLAAALACTSGTAFADDSQPAVDRLYILDCGQALVDDISTWSPGVNEGQARTFSNHCYLIKHGAVWMLWDTGVPDAWADSPEGVVGSPGVRGVVSKTLTSQLTQLGLAPEDIDFLAFSHGHFDHVGNANLFTKATWLVQEIEYDAMLGPQAEDFRFQPKHYAGLANNPVRKLDGDHDVFGDGAVQIISTPGHSPGHQSLLVRLTNYGNVILSGDVAHFGDNLQSRRVPVFNTDEDASRRSMDRIEALAEAKDARLWINHDLTQSDALVKAPRWFD